MQRQSDGSVPEEQEIAVLRARAAAGDTNAAGRLGEILSNAGDHEGALRVWVEAHGDEYPTTKRLAELRAETEGIRAAVGVWLSSDAVSGNPEGLEQEYRKRLPADDWRMDDDPEDWAFIEGEQLARLLAQRGDAANCEPPAD